MYKYQFLFRNPKMGKLGSSMDDVFVWAVKQLETLAIIPSFITICHFCDKLASATIISEELK